MSGEVRRAVVNTLVELAASRDYRDRADAGRAMAGFAEMPEARGPLLRLLLDRDDTFVTQATAEALLRRRDTAGVAAVALALATADANHVDWIHDAVIDVFGIFARHRDTGLRACEELVCSPDESLRRGAAQLRVMLTEINPVLQPARDDGV